MTRKIVYAAVLLWTASAAAEEKPLSQAIEEAYAAHSAGRTKASDAQLRQVYRRLAWSNRDHRAVFAQLLERDSEALVELHAFLDSCDNSQCDSDAVAEANARIASILSSSGSVTLSQPGMLTVIDSRSSELRVVNEYLARADTLTLRVRAGEHTFLMTTSDGNTCEWQVTVEAGTQQEYSCPPPPKSASTRPRPLAPPPPLPPARENSWLIPGLVGGGAVAAGAALGMYIQAGRVSADTEEQFDDLCRNQDLDPRCGVGFDAADGAWRTGAAVLTGVAATAVLAGTAVYLWGQDEAPVTAWVSPMGGGLRATF